MNTGTYQHGLLQYRHSQMLGEVMNIDIWRSYTLKN